MNKRKTSYICMALAVFLSGLLVSSIYDVVPTLSKRGSQSDEVREIQQHLKDEGIFNGTIDGIYGDQTESAVRAYQRKYSLGEDGIVGDKTLSHMRAKKAEKENQKTPTQPGEQENNQQKEPENLPGTGEQSPNNQEKQPSEEEKSGEQGGKENTGEQQSGNNEAEEYAIDFTSYERNLLARAINAESRGEPYEGQVAVGAVIVNRVLHPSFPNSITGVLYQPGAFASVRDGQINAEVYESAIQAAEEALAGLDPTAGAVYFFNPDKTKNKFMHSLTPSRKIGSHIFAHYQ